MSIDALIRDTLFDQYKRCLTTFTEQIVGKPSSANDDPMISVLAQVIAHISQTTGRPLAETLRLNLIDSQE